MDPNITLAEIRRLAKKIQEDYEDHGCEAIGINQEEANSLASYIDVLDNWILNGGFLPSNWDRTKK
jgi:hypothetical protein